jgi:thiol:disulfide interchange protein DsbC
MKIFFALVALLLALLPLAARANEATAKPAIVIADLPLKIAIKQVRGNGKRMLVLFEDPTCIYCKQLETDIAGWTDVTIYTFLYPILSADSTKKARAIWCAGDREKAWNKWMLKGIAPAAAACDAGAIEATLALGKKLGIRATPTIFLANGERLSGAVPEMMLEMAISSPKVLSFQADQEKKLAPGSRVTQ